MTRPAPRAATRQGTLPFNRTSSGQTIKVPEKIVEAEVDFELSRHSFEFLNTTVRYSKFNVQCPHCKKYHSVRPTGGTGQDKGIADRLLYASNWFHRLLPATLWLSVELKGSHTPFSSPEQQWLYEQGHTVIARDGLAALQAARDVDYFWQYLHDLEAILVRIVLGAVARDASAWKAAVRDAHGLLVESQHPALTS